MLEHHEPSRPDLWRVCAYVRDHSEADQQLEHTMTQTAQAIILLDIEQFGEPRSFQAIAIESIGWPGPQQAIEPRHWYWALLEEARFMISIDQRPQGGIQ